MTKKSSLRRILSFAAFGLGLTMLAGCGPASALLHDPKNLPCLRPNCQIRYAPRAEAYAEAVEKILPRAMAKIELIQGRPFGDSFVVVAYADESAYAAANGRGSTRPGGVTFMDRVTLSPRLFRDEPSELEPDLTHELSHAHLLSHISALAMLRIPLWFTEGLAVMASDGGGAQKISAAEARRAIHDGLTIETPDSTGPFGQNSLPFVKGFRNDNPYRQAHMAYRQAGMFVAYLRDRDRQAFGGLMDDIYRERPFAQALRENFGGDAKTLWRDFAGSL